MVSLRFPGSLVAPICIPLSSTPVIFKPPLIINSIELPLLSLLPVTLQKVVGVRFHVLPKRGTASVNNYTDKFILVRGVSKQVKPIANDSIMIPPSPSSIVINRTLGEATEPTVSRRFPFRSRQIFSVRSSPRTSTFPDLCVVNHLIFLADECRVKVLVRKSWKRVVVLRFS